MISFNTIWIWSRCQWRCQPACQLSGRIYLLASPALKAACIPWLQGSFFRACSQQLSLSFLPEPNSLSGYSLEKMLCTRQMCLERALHINQYQGLITWSFTWSYPQSSFFLIRRHSQFLVIRTWLFSGSFFYWLRVILMIWLTTLGSTITILVAYWNKQVSKRSTCLVLWTALSLRDVFSQNSNFQMIIISNLYLGRHSIFTFRNEQHELARQCNRSHLVTTI